MQRRGNNPSNAVRGFTFLELMVVMSIMAIMIAVAIPIYSQSVLKARERALRADLSNLNSLIVEYTLDKQKAPQGLDDLRSAGYLREIPKDPITKEPNWEVVQEEVLISPDQQDTGITGVHSASEAISSEGDAYNTW
jgi:general secretion pathway protein G